MHCDNLFVNFQWYDFTTFKIFLIFTMYCSRRMCMLKAAKLPNITYSPLFYDTHTKKIIIQKTSLFFPDENFCKNWIGSIKPCLKITCHPMSENLKDFQKKNACKCWECMFLNSCMQMQSFHAFQRQQICKIV